MWREEGVEEFCVLEAGGLTLFMKDRNIVMYLWRAKSHTKIHQLHLTSPLTRQVSTDLYRRGHSRKEIHHLTSLTFELFARCPHFLNSLTTAKTFKYRHVGTPAAPDIARPLDDSTFTLTRG